jgi:hypothetical protein
MSNKMIFKILVNIAAFELAMFFILFLEIFMGFRIESKIPYIYIYLFFLGIPLILSTPREKLNFFKKGTVPLWMRIVFNISLTISILSFILSFFFEILNEMAIRSSFLTFAFFGFTVYYLEYNRLLGKKQNEENL